MLITPHALTGAAIATQTGNPLLAFPLSLASHFILDSIPHWQETLYPYKPKIQTWIRIPLDIILTVLLVYLIAQHHQQQSTLVWVSAFLATAPDLDSIASIYQPILNISLFKKFYNWHTKIQRETKSFLGVISQLIVILLSLAVAIF